MSWLSGGEFYPSSWNSSSYPGLGILFENIPSDGENGASPLLNDGGTSGDEIRWGPAVVTAGSLTILQNEDTSFTSTGGVGEFYYPWWKNGVLQPDATVSIISGSYQHETSFTLEIQSSQSYSSLIYDAYSQQISLTSVTGVSSNQEVKDLLSTNVNETTNSSALASILLRDIISQELSKNTQATGIFLSEISGADQHLTFVVEAVNTYESASSNIFDIISSGLYDTTVASGTLLSYGPYSHTTLIEETLVSTSYANISISDKFSTNVAVSTLVSFVEPSSIRQKLKFPVAELFYKLNLGVRQL